MEIIRCENFSSQSSDVPVNPWTNIPCFGKMRVFLLTQGWEGSLAWAMTDREGLPVNFNDCADQEPEIKTSFLEVGRICAEPILLDGAIVDSNEGTVTVDLPPAITELSSIYYLDWALTLNGRRVLINQTLCSVEGSNFAVNAGEARKGSLTIQEVRMALIDTCAADNHLLNATEFSNSDIVEAIISPLRLWNETAPFIDFVADSRTFPFRENWRNATIALLLRRMATNYMRNRLPSSGGGLSVDDKNKYAPYLQLSQMMFDEWRQFVISTKVAINSGTYGEYLSVYSNGVY